MRLTKEELPTFEESLVVRGYRKFRGKLENEDYYFFKNFAQTRDEFGNMNGGYMIVFQVWDFSVYPQNSEMKPVSIGYKFMLLGSKHIDRLDLCVSDLDATVEQFEEMCEKFYQDFCVGYVFETFRK